MGIITYRRLQFTADIKAALQTGPIEMLQVLVSIANLYEASPKSIRTEFISLVPYVTLRLDFSERVAGHLPVCPQSARRHCSQSV